jgi:hypoxanthine phosphoribosyltransferase
LFVDDIFDSGKTFNDIFLHVDDGSKFIFATLYARRGMTYPKQLIYGEKTFDDSYVVFPWDKLEFKNNIQ